MKWGKNNKISNSEGIMGIRGYNGGSRDSSKARENFRFQEKIGKFYKF